MMHVLFIDNGGGGYAQNIETVEGMTVEQMVQRRIGDEGPREHMIRLNGKTVAADHVLQDGDRLTVTPLKISGA